MTSLVNLPRFTVTGRSLCDLELLLVGAFNPLKGFLGKEDYESVVYNMRLKDGSVWPMPIVYSIEETEKEKWSKYKEVVLVDETNLPLALFKIGDIYQPDLEVECQKVFGTTDTNHPYVGEILSNPNRYYVGGEVEMINRPFHFDFSSIRLTPDEVKSEIKRRGWKKVVGFQTRNPMHRSHQELTIRARREMMEEDPSIKEDECGILLHPVVGVTQECDVNYHTRVRCYKSLIQNYPNDCATLALLPLSMRMGGPREALWHSLIRRNYGCTHFIVGRDHAGPSYMDKEGNPFYGPYDAHTLVEKFSDEIGLKVLMSKMIVYLPNEKQYLPINEVVKGQETLNISGTQLREILSKGDDLPSWFTYPGISKILQQETSPSHKRGFCIYVVGLSGSGKSVIVKALHERLTELDSRNITILDGDVVRQELSKGLGFSRDDRSTNVRRIGYVASEVVKHGGICLCSNIAPYDEDRRINRTKISAFGGYYEAFVDTPLEKCEERDCKGLYKMAREGKIKEFTGISDPFERPETPEFSFNNSNKEHLDRAVSDIISRLEEDCFIRV